MGTPDKALHVLPIIALKFALGLLFGYLIDLVMTKSRKKVEHHVKHCDEQYKIRLTECRSAEVVEKKEPTYNEKCDCEECKECERFEEESKKRKKSRPPTRKSKRRKKNKSATDFYSTLSNTHLKYSDTYSS